MDCATPRDHPALEPGAGLGHGRLEPQPTAAFVGLEERRPAQGGFEPTAEAIPIPLFEGHQGRADPLPEAWAAPAKRAAWAGSRQASASTAAASSA